MKNIYKRLYIKTLILEGLELMLVELNNTINYETKGYKYQGLCQCIRKLFNNSVYLHDNEIGHYVGLYIKKHKPIKFYIINHFLYINYYWKPYNYIPRIKYLNKHINKLTKEISKLNKQLNNLSI